MPSFLHPSLFWTLGLPTLGVVAIPVLIHLINMMRHRRVKWAAMEFLRVSQKKNRTWVILKQLLLLLLRMFALAMVVFLVAQPRFPNRLGNLFGGSQVHHIVLLDDSFSMSDRWADTDAFSQAKKVIQRIGADAVRQNRVQFFTLLRFSRVGRSGRASEPDLLKQPLGAEFSLQLEELLAKADVTQDAAGALPSLRAIAQLLGDGDGQRRVLYLVSDFRTRQWNEPTDLREELLQLNNTGMEIHLIDCVDRGRPNLAITSLAPAEGIRAAGVSWFMDVGVRNFGSTPAREVSVALGEDGHGRPSVTLKEIPPGKTTRGRFQVSFLDAGPHEITARLESDAVDADNHRFHVADLPADVPVLLIDGGDRALDSRYLSFALAPGEPVRTGIRPQIETPRYLSVKPLENYLAINLTNVERLDSSAVDALEKYVADGGGVAFFLGDRCRAKYYNDVLYRNGEGIFPVPLVRPTELLIDRLDPAPDVQVGKHFIFRVFAAVRNTFLQTVSVQRYFATPEDWLPPAGSTVRIAARLRNGAPLVVERSFGKGRVVAFLTTAAPTWNSWARNPSFVVAMQDLQAYLSRRSDADRSRQVGSPLEVRLDPAVYQPQVRFTSPVGSVVPETAVDAARSDDGALVASLPGTDLSGFYEARLARANGVSETRRFALNVDPMEGDLAMLDGEQLASRLKGVQYRFEQASSFQFPPTEFVDSNLAEALLYGLILLLIGEQILAWSAGYHPAEQRRPIRGGAA